MLSFISNQMRNSLSIEVIYILVFTNHEDLEISHILTKTLLNLTLLCYPVCFYISK